LYVRVPKLLCSASLLTVSTFLNDISSLTVANYCSALHFSLLYTNVTCCQYLLLH